MSRRKESIYSNWYWWWLAVSIISVVLTFVLVNWAAGCDGSDILDGKSHNLLLICSGLSAAMLAGGAYVVHDYKHRISEESDPQKKASLKKYLSLTFYGLISSPFACCLLFTAVYLIQKPDRSVAKKESEKLIETDCVGGGSADPFLIYQTAAGLTSDFTTHRIENSEIASDQDWLRIRAEIAAYRNKKTDSLVKTLTIEETCRRHLAEIVDSLNKAFGDTSLQRINEYLSLSKALKEVDASNEAEVKAIMSEFSIEGHALLITTEQESLGFLTHAIGRFSTKNPGADRICSVTRLKKEHGLITEITIKHL